MPTASTPVDTGGHAGTQLAAEQLSTERVLAAALHLVDSEGLDALTMRRLGRALGRQAMSVYRYAGTGRRCSTASPSSSSTSSSSLPLTADAP